MGEKWKIAANGTNDSNGSGSRMSGYGSTLEEH